MDSKSLRLLDRFRMIFKWFGVDYDEVRMILGLKQTIDKRRQTTVLNNGDVSETKDMFMKSLLIYALMGAFTCVVFLFNDSVFIGMTIYLALMMFFTMNLMISDFSSVLLDLKDRNLLGTLPLKKKSIAVAKGLHMGIYLLLISLALSAGGFIAGGIKFGVGFVVMLLVIMVLNAFLTTTLATLIYGAILNWFDGEKLKDVINGFQILLAVTFVFGYQIVLRMFDVVEGTLVYQPRLWHYLLPPAWFAAPFEMIVRGTYNQQLMLLSALAIIVPIVLVIVNNKYILPGFEQVLAKLNTVEKVTVKAKKRKLSVSRFVCRDHTERGVYEFSKLMFRKERSFKLKVLPTLAMSALFPLLFLVTDFSDYDSFSHFVAELREGRSYFYIYLGAMMLSSMLYMLWCSDKPKGVWLFKTLPLEDPTKIIRGSLKAFILNYYLPAFLVPCLTFYLIYGPLVFNDMVVAFIAILFNLCVALKMFGKKLPFSSDFKEESKTSVGQAFFQMFLSGGLCGIHYLISKNELFVTLYGIGLLILTIVMWRHATRTTWEEVRS